jgi:hypothetical protein
MPTFVHGKATVIKVATFDLSVYTKTSTIELNPDIHETTGYTLDDATYQGGIRRGTFTMSGIYDSTSAGPRQKLKPLNATTVAIIRQPEGVGTTKAQDSFSAVVGKYVETEPNDDMVTWSQDFTITGPIVATPQP